MDIKLFQQKLNEICEIAEENGKQLSQQQIREHFDESDLNTSQLVKILQYLKLKGNYYRRRRKSCRYFCA